jgi:putative hydrolase of the HAD superfamily
MGTPAAILLDLDGTLTDRARSVFTFAREFHRRFVNDLGAHDDVSNQDSVGHNFAGQGRYAITKALLTADGDGRHPRQLFFCELRRVLPWTQVPAPGVLEAFWRITFPMCARPTSRLHQSMQRLTSLGVRLGVVTNGTGTAQRRKIETLGIGHYLAAVIISGEVGFRKPDRRIFEEALKVIGGSPDQTWYVGDDSVQDVAGAQAAGLTPVWVSGMAHPVDCRSAVRRIRRFAELPFCVRNTGSS